MIQALFAAIREAASSAVSPDGRWIAFIEDYNAYVAPFAVTGKTVEIGKGSETIPVRQVASRSGEALHWSGDSDALHWAHGATLYSRPLKEAFAFLQGVEVATADRTKFLSSQARRNSRHRRAIRAASCPAEFRALVAIPKLGIQDSIRMHGIL